MDLFEQQAHLQPYFAKSYACAVFGTIAKAGFYFGGARGKGDVYLLLHTTTTDGGVGIPTKKKIGQAELRQVSAGFQAGGQVLAEIIFFENKVDLEQFQAGHLVLGADANVVALTASASTKVSTMGNQQGIQYGWSAEDTQTLKVLPKLKGAATTTGTTTTTSSTSTEAKYTKGTAIFTLPLGGFMVEATISGQKFTYKALESTTVEEEIHYTSTTPVP
jgi:hypothetical protein